MAGFSEMRGLDVGLDPQSRNLWDLHLWGPEIREVGFWMSWGVIAGSTNRKADWQKPGRGWGKFLLQNLT